MTELNNLCKLMLIWIWLRARMEILMESNALVVKSEVDSSTRRLRFWRIFIISEFEVKARFERRKARNCQRWSFGWDWVGMPIVVTEQGYIATLKLFQARGRFCLRERTEHLRGITGLPFSSPLAYVDYFLLLAECIFTICWVSSQSFSYIVYF